jgi:hypothetical protein
MVIEVMHNTGCTDCVNSRDIKEATLTIEAWQPA